MFGIVQLGIVGDALDAFARVAEELQWQPVEA
jgi:hypothetical protein